MELGAAERPGRAQEGLVYGWAVDDRRNGETRAGVSCVEFLGYRFYERHDDSAPFATNGGMIEQDKDKLCFW